jgi:hypothetical protein
MPARDLMAEPGCLCRTAEPCEVGCVERSEDSAVQADYQIDRRREVQVLLTRPRNTPRV